MSVIQVVSSVNGSKPIPFQPPQCSCDMSLVHYPPSLSLLLPTYQFVFCNLESLVSMFASLSMERGVAISRPILLKYVSNFAIRPSCFNILPLTDFISPSTLSKRTGILEFKVLTCAWSGWSPSWIFCSGQHEQSHLRKDAPQLLSIPVLLLHFVPGLNLRFWAGLSGVMLALALRSDARTTTKKHLREKNPCSQWCHPKTSCCHIGAPSLDVG